MNSLWMFRTNEPHCTQSYSQCSVTSEDTDMPGQRFSIGNFLSSPLKAYIPQRHQWRFWSDPFMQKLFWAFASCATWLKYDSFILLSQRAIMQEAKYLEKSIKLKTNMAINSSHENWMIPDQKMKLMGVINRNGYACQSKHEIQSKSVLAYLVNSNLIKKKRICSLESKFFPLWVDTFSKEA